MLDVVTGFPEPDAGAAFARERRRASLARLASRLSTRRKDALALLRFDDVVAALGRVAERDLGLREIALDSIVGTVDRRSGEFDRLFRPRDRRLHSRWQRIAAARRRGETMPPIDVYRIGELHFVQDGHHRVSVARAHADVTIEAHVREVQTTVSATAGAQPWLERTMGGQLLGRNETLPAAGTTKVCAASYGRTPAPTPDRRAEPQCRSIRRAEHTRDARA